MIFWRIFLPVWETRQVKYFQKTQNCIYPCFHYLISKPEEIYVMKDWWSPNEYQKWVKTTGSQDTCVWISEREQTVGNQEEREKKEEKNATLELYDLKDDFFFFFLWDTGQNTYIDQRSPPSLVCLMMWFIPAPLKYVFYFVKKYNYLICLKTLVSKNRHMLFFIYGCF